MAETTRLALPRHTHSLVVRGVLVLTYLFLLAPILMIALASFEKNQVFYFRFPPEEFSLRWYHDFPASYLHSVQVSVTVGVVAGIMATLLGAAAALGIVRGRFRNKAALQSLMRIPVQIPFVVTGVVFLQFFYRLSDFGVSLLGTQTAIIIAHVFFSMPYAMGTTYAALNQMNPRLEEAAQSLGASSWTTFWAVLFPAAKPGLFAGFFYCFIVSIGDVPISLFLAGPDSVTFPVQIFQALEFDFQPAVLSLSTLFCIASGLAVILTQRLVGLDLVLPSRTR